MFNPPIPLGFSDSFKSLTLLLGFMLIACSNVMAMAADTGASPFGDGFAKMQLTAYLQPMGQKEQQHVTRITAPQMQGKAVLQFAGNTSVSFLDVSVQENTKYTLSMRARYDGAEAIEENPLFDIFLQFGRRTDVVPQRDIIFLDIEGKRLSSLTTGIVFRQWHLYEDVFYTPAGTAFIRLTVDSGQEDIVLLLDDIKLGVTSDEGAINCNPIWSKRGPYNYSGWSRLAVGGKLIALEDGKVIFDTQYTSIGQVFPLNQPGWYELTTVSTSKGYSPAIMLNMLDANNKPTGQVRVGGRGYVRGFVLPEGTTQAYFNIRSVLLEELRVVRIGDVQPSASQPD